MTKELWGEAAVDMYVKCVPYYDSPRWDFTASQCLAYLYERGMTTDQHRRLLQLRNRYQETLVTVSNCLAELDRSMDAKEPESSRLQTWSDLKQAKALRQELAREAQSLYCNEIVCQTMTRDK